MNVKRILYTIKWLDFIISPYKMVWEASTVGMQGWLSCIKVYICFLSMVLAFLVSIPKDPTIAWSCGDTIYARQARIVVLIWFIGDKNVGGCKCWDNVHAINWVWLITNMYFHLTEFWWVLFRIWLEIACNIHLQYPTISSKESNFINLNKV